MTDHNTTRMRRLGYRKPADVAEPDELVLVEFVSDGRVAIITLNRPHADNAITTELAAQLIEVLETIAARSSVRVAIMMDEHWRSVIHPDRVEGIRAFTEDREPTFPDPDF